MKDDLRDIIFKCTSSTGIVFVPKAIDKLVDYITQNFILKNKVLTVNEIAED